MTDHDQFDSLCAMAAANLTLPEEDQLLAEHLHDCATCKQAFYEYKEISARIYQESTAYVPVGLHSDAAEREESEKLFSKICNELRRQGYEFK